MGGKGRIREEEKTQGGKEEERRRKRKRKLRGCKQSRTRSKISGWTKIR